MSKPNALKGIRDSRLRELAKAATKQDFELGLTANRHAYLRCPACSTRITFSKTAPASSSRAYLTRLWKHGLTYEGRGGRTHRATARNHHHALYVTTGSSAHATKEETMSAENVDDLDDDDFFSLVGRISTGTASDQEVQDAKDSAAKARDARGK